MPLIQGRHKYKKKSLGPMVLIANPHRYLNKYLYIKIILSKSFSETFS